MVPVVTVAGTGGGGGHDGASGSGGLSIIGRSVTAATAAPVKWTDRRNWRHRWKEVAGARNGGGMEGNGGNGGAGGVGVSAGGDLRCRWWGGAGGTSRAVTAWQWREC